jgi:hypothetical protein
LNSVRFLRKADLKNTDENPTYSNQDIANGGSKMKHIQPEVPGYKSSGHESGEAIKDAECNPKDAHGNKDSLGVLGRIFLRN